VRCEQGKCTKMASKVASSDYAVIELGGGSVYVALCHLFGLSA
jgi:hypothetical protein